VQGIKPLRVQGSPCQVCFEAEHVTELPYLQWRARCITMAGGGSEQHSCKVRFVHVYSEDSWAVGMKHCFLTVAHHITTDSTAVSGLQLWSTRRWVGWVAREGAAGAGPSPVPPTACLVWPNGDSWQGLQRTWPPQLSAPHLNYKLPLHQQRCSDRPRCWQQRGEDEGLAGAGGSLKMLQMVFLTRQRAQATKSVLNGMWIHREMRPKLMGGR